MNLAKRIMVKCPTCRKEVLWQPESQYRPFCSQRCKMVDLGAWADEGYAVAAEEKVVFSEIHLPY